MFGMKQSTTSDKKKQSKDVEITECEHDQRVYTLPNGIVMTACKLPHKKPEKTENKS